MKRGGSRKRGGSGPPDPPPLDTPMAMAKIESSGLSGSSGACLLVKNIDLYTMEIQISGSDHLILRAMGFQNYLLLWFW